MQNEYIFSDFDGTITKYDAVHKFITTYSKGDWTIAENLWLKGKMTTKECLSVQMNMIKDIKKSDLKDFLDSIEIDETFIEFYKLVKKYDKTLIILSDGFDIFIEGALKKYNLENIKFYSNKLIIKENKGYLTFETQYPFMQKDCFIGSGNCKCGVARKYSKNYTYIGDGMSDRCIAKKSSLLFAKKSLETFCIKENIPYFPYKTFQDIIDALFKENLNADNDVKTFNGR